jgi:hypothetical protein
MLSQVRLSRILAHLKSHPDHVSNLFQCRTCRAVDEWSLPPLEEDIVVPSATIVLEVNDRK